MFPLKDDKNKQFPHDGTVCPELFSKWAILLATVIGSPIAGGFLIYRNCKNLQLPRKGLASLVFCVLLTVICVATALLLPEYVLMKIPPAIFPLIYMTAVYLLTDGTMTKLLTEHEIACGLFYPLRKAVLTGVVCLIVILLFYLAIFSLSPDRYKHPAYTSAMREFGLNESKALALFELIAYAPPEVVSAFIREEGVPAWQENIALLTRLNAVADLHPDVKYRVNGYISYCNLRISYFELTDRAMTENTNKYDEQLKFLDAEINSCLRRAAQTVGPFDRQRAKGRRTY
ncbi:MAG: hypothetical protein LBH80_02395 [Prevotellaceae bacterium]|jgi:hypothetical protein|nr:hypothetical protein [Prevotellaceae bacterium]